jgi:hypothetical protein
MTAVSLRILEPRNGAALAGTTRIRLRAAVISGSAAGLFFRWFSTLNPAATAEHPELNATNHSAAVLDWTPPAPLDVGSHVLTLAAADRDGADLDAVRAVTRAGFAGGAPDDNPNSCVVHQVVAVLRTPGADNQSLSKASATLEVRGPALWAKRQPPLTGPYVLDSDYQDVNGIRYRFRLAPDGPPDAARTTEWVPPAADLTYFIADDLPWLRWRGALPADLGTGVYVLTLFCETLDGAVRHSAARKVNLVA